MLLQSLCSFISDTQFIDKQIYGIIYYLGKLKYFTEMILRIKLFCILKALEGKYCSENNTDNLLKEYLA